MANATVTPTAGFDARAHLVSLGRRGGREQMYLEVKWRLVWFRAERPDWGITTEPVQIDLERQTAIFRAQVIDDQGRVVATGTALETAAKFGDFVEKAETSSIGRALAVAGFGTQFTDLEEGAVVDSPVCAQATAGNGNGHAAGATVCQECGAGLTPGQATLSKERHGKPLCPACQGR